MDESEQNETKWYLMLKIGISQMCRNLQKYFKITKFVHIWNDLDNRRAHIRHQCWKTTVLSCHKDLINTGIEQMNSISI
jgi:hypothetical protein